ncbi:MAG: chemotaxis-specific protein-glutamate methyltransferase CheB [Caulobacteraceae bacterium]|nr:chemotaxis-specific protein-glutamate methyltransferase CheB [Caulobacteraceae bacterium]
MGKIRALVVEDSHTVRRRLVEILESDPEFEVVGEAEDGRRAIELCMERRPDLITMDMMLPVMSGLAATEYIMAHFPTPILIVSASTNRGEVFKTYDALAAGAVDVLEKMSGREAEGVWERDFLARAKLVAKIRVITHPRARLALSGAPPIVTASPVMAARPGLRVVAVGASTGGPRAVSELLRALPPSFQLPVLLVLHINEPFGAAFADWLDSQTARPVSYATQGAPVSASAGRVAIAPAGRHLEVREGRFHLTRDAERHSCRPSIDVLFESVAASYGPSAAACLLTGMGRDGAAGLLALRRAGALTIAQDEATSVIYGMPREAVLLGAAERVLPLGEIGAALVRAAEIRT